MKWSAAKQTPKFSISLAWLLCALTPSDSIACIGLRVRVTNVPLRNASHMLKKICIVCVGLHVLGTRTRDIVMIWYAPAVDFLDS